MIMSRLFDLRAGFIVNRGSFTRNNDKLEILKLELIRSQHGGLVSKMELL